MSGSIKARPFDFPYDGNLDPARLALLVIDLQVDFVAPEGYLARRGYDVTPVRAILPAVRAVTEAVRRVGGLVVFTRQGYRVDLADMTDYERFRRRRGGLDGTQVLVRGSPGFEIAPELPVEPADVIVDKTANGAFTYTDLEQVLRVRGIEQVMLTGATTDVCVHSTLREAHDRNFQCLLIEDGCASGDAYAHAAAVHMVTVEDGVWGVVAKAADVVAGLHTLSG
jgi:biuret amidohydrolase